MMLLHSLFSAGALAVTANAFLLPLNHNGPLPDDLSIYSGSQKVVLDCSRCPYALQSEQNGKRDWKNDVPSDLEMELSVDKNSILFNGVPIYPITTPGLPPTLSVSQKAKGEAEEAEKGNVENLRMSYSLEMIQKPFDDGNTLLTMTMTIMALENEMIRIDDLEIKTIKDAQGNLIIHSAKSVPASPDSPDAKCSNVLCRVFAKFLVSVAKAKASAKTAAHKIKDVCLKCFRCVLHMVHKGHRHHHHHAANHGNGAAPHRRPDGTMELPTHIKAHPGKFHGDTLPPPRPEWVNRGFLGRMGHIMWVAIKVAFIPVLVGVAFGMAASAIGMLIGQAIVFLWMRYRRSDECPAYEQLVVDVKEEVPPPYEDAPGTEFESVSEKEVEAKV